MRLMSLVVALGLVCLAAGARVGESRQQCDARYGQPLRVNDTDSLVTYKYRGYSVVVHFSTRAGGGSADMVTFQKLPPLTGKPAPDLTEQEIVQILQTNGGDRVWVEGPEQERWRTWRTVDGELVAVLDRRASYLMVYAKDFVLTERVVRVSAVVPAGRSAAAPRLRERS